MKVILLQEVPGLGKPGDVKEVANGYARNYLLPHQLVTAATPGELANLQQRVSAAKRRTEKQRQAHESIATRLASAELKFAVRVGRGDRLYGSVTSQDIANALEEQEQITIDRRTIQLREPLRTLGTFEVPVRVAPKVEPKVKVTLVASDQLPEDDEDAPADAIEATAGDADAEEATSAE
jgi:large subunit ribosomal protein L9